MLQISIRLLLLLFEELFTYYFAMCVKNIVNIVEEEARFFQSSSSFKIRFTNLGAAKLMASRTKSIDCKGN